SVVVAGGGRHRDEPFGDLAVLHRPPPAVLLGQYPTQLTGTVGTSTGACGEGSHVRVEGSYLCPGEAGQQRPPRGRQVGGQPYPHPGDECGGVWRLFLEQIQGVGAVQDAKVRGGTGGLAELMQQWSRKAFDTVMTQVGRADLEGRDPQAPPPFLGRWGAEPWRGHGSQELVSAGTGEPQFTGDHRCRHRSGTGRQETQQAQRTGGRRNMTHALDRRTPGMSARVLAKEARCAPDGTIVARPPGPELNRQWKRSPLRYVRLGGAARATCICGAHRIGQEPRSCPGFRTEPSCWGFSPYEEHDRMGP